MTFPIHEREQRARLEIRAKPYFIRISDGLHLGYRKGKSVSRWVIRRNCDGRYQTHTVDGAEPDDAVPANGKQILSFQQMVGRLMTSSKGKVSCSFCSKSHLEVAKLVAGPGVYICNECIALCQIYMDHPYEPETKLLVENGKAVVKDGKPVFVRMSDEERDRFRDLLG